MMSTQLEDPEILHRPSHSLGSRKYRIAVFHNIPSGGARRAIYDYMQVLSGSGHTFDVFDYTSSNCGVLPLEEYAGRITHYPFEGSPELSVRLPLLSGHVENIRKLRRFRSLRKIGTEIAQAVNTGGYDLAFIHHCSVVQAPYLLRCLDIPSVFYSGDPPRGLYEPPVPRHYPAPRRSPLLKLRDMWYGPAACVTGWIDDWALKHVYERNMEHVDVLMANSYYSMETFYKLHGIRARVVHPGIDAEEFRPIGAGKKNIVLSVGGLEPVKGHDFLIEALSSVNKHIRPELHIVANRGYGVEKEFLTELAKELKVELVFEESVPQWRLVELYNHAKLTLCGAVLEPFGLTPLESMACGTPVVAVREGGYRESIAHGESGVLCARDPALFGKAVEELLADENIREDIGEKARKHVLRNWTLQRVKADLLNLFDETVNRDE